MKNDCRKQGEDRAMKKMKLSNSKKWNSWQRRYVANGDGRHRRYRRICTQGSSFGRGPGMAGLTAGEHEPR